MTHILLIDDHPLFCGGFVATCASLRPDYRVTLAASAAQARDKVEISAPFNCILIDILLPDANGFDTLQSLAQLDPLTPRVMISGRDDRTAKLRARHLGASGFISKSLSPAEIMTAIDCILGGGIHFDDGDSHDEDGENTDGTLTPRQLEVLDLLAQGCANKEIEDRLGLADRTVRAHLTVIFKMLGVQSRIRAVMEARSRGLIL